MEKVVLNVDGMSCSHCVKAITKALSALQGVSKVDIDLDGKTVTVEYDVSVGIDSIKEAIEDQGYDIVA